jgi:hypothetical protein
MPRWSRDAHRDGALLWRRAGRPSASANGHPVRDRGPPAEVKVADAGALASPPEPPRPETLARTMRRWHDGTDMGLVWQVVIFLGGIIPALLSITGLIIWWRARRARRRVQALMPATA